MRGHVPRKAERFVDEVACLASSVEREEELDSVG